MQRLGQRTGRSAKALVGGLLLLASGRGSERAAQQLAAARVLLVRPNFRIGNTLMATPLVAALRSRFPEASLDVLGSDVTRALFDGLAVDRVHAVSRLDLLRPWRYAGLVRRLRRERYDVAVDAGMGSFSGGLYAWLSGARERVGVGGAASPFLTVHLEKARVAHAYDRAPALALQLGAGCADRPIYAVSAREAERATAVLHELGLGGSGAVAPFLALFVGGHLEKRWPEDSWLELAGELERRRARFLVFSGPEERRLAARLSERLAQPGRVVAPRPLRDLAALLARAALVVSPDSGPMHLAAALQRPTIAVLQADRSLRFRPRGEHDVVLMRPTTAAVVDAVTRHPLWPRVAGEAEVGAPPA